MTKVEYVNRYMAADDAGDADQEIADQLLISAYSAFIWGKIALGKRDF